MITSTGLARHPNRRSIAGRHPFGTCSPLSWTLGDSVSQLDVTLVVR